MDICNVYIHANATHKIGLINISRYWKVEEPYRYFSMHVST